MAEKIQRATRKVRVGTVISDKMDKSIIVRVDRTMKHPLYLKTIRTFSKLYAHDEKNEAKVGDLVQVMETKPLSKTKRWRLVEILEKAE
ncbi:MAG: 30S ribosomal protein S17 [candidate division Zixibacteria bacterium]|nr:30S ribosomal protein S17 [candidate division Zixibacteria bacterium]MDD5425452.1 30S ribosomal protein S17 [candidate division Zixibacteria bacterium]